VGGFNLRWDLEARHPAPLRVHRTKNAAYRPVLAGGVAPLKDDQQRALVLGIQEVLEVAKLFGSIRKVDLGFVTAQPLWLEVRVDGVEVDFLAGLDPKQSGVVHAFHPSQSLESSSYTGRDDVSQSCYDHSRRR